MKEKIQKLLNSELVSDRSIGKALLIKQHPELKTCLYNYDDNFLVLEPQYYRKFGYVYKGEDYPMVFLKEELIEWNQKKNLEKE